MADEKPEELCAFDRLILETFQLIGARLRHSRLLLPGAKYEE